jgi:hypothetical protein
MTDRTKETLEQLRRNGFTAVFAADRAAAQAEVMDLIPVGSTVGIGDSVSVRQTGAIEQLQENGRIVVNPFSESYSKILTTGQISEEQSARVDRLALQCEYFLTGTNVLTATGKLLNVDGAGNRVVGQMFGPEKVVLVAGTNKIVADLEAGFDRMRQVIAPQHARTKNRNTPCVRTGECEDCHSPERICNVTGIIERNPTLTDISIVLVEEDLGLGWDPEWSEGRVSKLRNSYEELTWIKNPEYPDE